MLASRRFAGVQPTLCQRLKTGLCCLCFRSTSYATLRGHWSATGGTREPLARTLTRTAKVLVIQDPFVHKIHQLNWGSDDLCVGNRVRHGVYRKYVHWRYYFTQESKGVSLFFKHLSHMWHISAALFGGKGNAQSSCAYVNPRQIPELFRGGFPA